MTDEYWAGLYLDSAKSESDRAAKQKRDDKWQRHLVSGGREPVKVIKIKNKEVNDAI